MRASAMVAAALQLLLLRKCEFIPYFLILTWSDGLRCSFKSSGKMPTTELQQIPIGRINNIADEQLHSRYFGTHVKTLLNSRYEISTRLPGDRSGLAPDG